MNNCTYLGGRKEWEKSTSEEERDKGSPGPIWRSGCEETERGGVLISAIFGEADVVCDGVRVLILVAHFVSSVLDFFGKKIFA